MNEKIKLLLESADLRIGIQESALPRRAVCQILYDYGCDMHMIARIWSYKHWYVIGNYLKKHKDEYGTYELYTRIYDYMSQYKEDIYKHYSEQIPIIIQKEALKEIEKLTLKE